MPTILSKLSFQIFPLIYLPCKASRFTSFALLLHHINAQILCGLLLTKFSFLYQGSHQWQIMVVKKFNFEFESHCLQYHWRLQAKWNQRYARKKGSKRRSPLHPPFMTTPLVNIVVCFQLDCREEDNDASPQALQVIWTMNVKGFTSFPFPP